jgi:hypothetical protein
MLLCAALLLLVGQGCSDGDGGGDKKPYGKVTLEQLVDACIVSSACQVKTYPRISNCVEDYYNLALRLGRGPVYDQIFGCLAEAKGDCDAAFECYGSHRAAGSCDTTYQAKCDGEKALTCDTLAGKVFTFDCSHAGLTCKTRSPGSAGTFEADCTPGGCKSGDPRQCDGDKLISCKGDGNLELVDCSVQGLTCAPSPATAALECTGETTEECDMPVMPPDPYTPKCEGSVALTCVNNRVHREDCAQRPYNKGCKDGACVPAGKQCTDEFNRCQGEKLQYCLDGAWRTADCAALGLGPCKTLTNGADCTEQK